jgi:septum formation protein
MAPNPPNIVSPNALAIPAFKKLTNKRVVLASKSPRRKEIFKTFGLDPEIVPSTFEENLPVSSFEDIHEYPVATATHKAVEVYEKLVEADPENPPDLVIGADTVVLSHAGQSFTSQAAYSTLPDISQELIEKPRDKDDNLRMLMDLNGGVCEVVTGVSLVYPVLSSPGYEIKSIDERTLVYFSDNSKTILKAYAESGEGLDAAGGWQIQGSGGLLVRKIEGDYNNVVGFPAASFIHFLQLLIDEDEDFLNI